MSKIAKKPISILEGVKAEISGKEIKFSGPKGSLSIPLMEFISCEIKDNNFLITKNSDNVQARANWGTMAALIRNNMEGVKNGFVKSLEIEGIGYKAQMEGKNLVLSVGFTHTVKIIPKDGIKIEVEKNVIKVSGMDKIVVGQTAAEIRKVKKPEPYKGKGIHYVGERVIRKEGKKVAGSTA